MRTIFLFVALVFSVLCNAQTLSDANRMSDNEQFESAKNAFEQLINGAPVNGTYYYYSGKSFLKNENVESAKAKFDTGIKADPNNPLNYVGLGHILYQQGNTAEANNNFFKAKTLAASKNANVLIEIAEVFITSEVKNIPEAQNLLNQAAKLDPKNPEVFILMGDANLEMNDGGKAIANYEKAVDMDKKSAKAKLRIGQLFGRAKNYNLSLDYYKEAVKIDSTFAPAYRQMAELYFKAGQAEKAASNYQKYLKLNDNLSARIRYASFKFVSKDYKTAISEIAEIQKKDSTDVNLFRLLGYCYYEVGDYGKGIMKMDKFFSLTNNSGKKIFPSDFEYLGKNQVKGGKDSLGIMNLLKAYQMDTSKIELYSEIGMAYSRQKKYPQAITFLEKKIALDKKGGNGNDFFYLGKAYYFSKDYVKADSAFSKLMRSNPNLPMGYFWKARCVVQNDPDSKQGLAKPYYEKHIEKVGTEIEKNKKDLVESYQYLAVYNYVVPKDYAKAKEMWLKVKELDPQNKSANDALKDPKLK